MVNPVVGNACLGCVIVDAYNPTLVVSVCGLKWKPASQWTCPLKFGGGVYDCVKMVADKRMKCIHKKERKSTPLKPDKKKQLFR